MRGYIDRVMLQTREVVALYQNLRSSLIAFAPTVTARQLSMRNLPTEVLSVRRRPVRLFLAVSVLASLGGAATFERLMRPLPHPSECSAAQLERWVALEDMSDYPVSFRVELANRFAQHLVSSKSSLALAEVDAKYRERVTKNRDLLVQAWLDDQAAQLADESTERQRERLKYDLKVLQSLMVGSAENQNALLEKVTSTLTPKEQVFLARMSMTWLETTPLESWAESERRHLMYRVDRYAEQAIAMSDTTSKSAQGTVHETPATSLQADGQMFDASQLFEQHPLSRQAERRLGMLVKAWLQVKANEYGSIEEHKDRQEFAEHQYRRCKRLVALSGTETPRVSLSSLQQIKVWLQPNDDAIPTAAVDPSEAQNFDQFVAALGRLWLADSLRPQVEWFKL